MTVSVTLSLTSKSVLTLSQPNRASVPHPPRPGPCPRVLWHPSRYSGWISHLLIASKFRSSHGVLHPAGWNLAGGCGGSAAHMHRQGQHHWNQPRGCGGRAVGGIGASSTPCHRPRLPRPPSAMGPIGQRQSRWPQREKPRTGPRETWPQPLWAALMARGRRQRRVVSVVCPDDDPG